ncbi:tRNA (adenine(58)-N(1))-methyltransferase non-catalytic subunit TRM6, variant 2 [Bonamia ostreae]|uniref:tRNA (adenine(58)-N(1))-methyltransferase non-catalytic subunit TRM6 n=1 Tax=Bonamia ostreae TaxID=126728 RepID=A0ABV2AGH1_9EUKA
MLKNMDKTNRIGSGDYVIIEYLNGHKIVKKIENGKNIKIFKKKVKCDFLIDTEYNLQYLIDDAGSILLDTKPGNYESLADNNDNNENSEIGDNKKVKLTDGERFKIEKTAKKRLLKKRKSFSVAKTNAVNLVNSLSPRSILFLRDDSLAKILTLANLNYKSTVIVYDHSEGFVTGALCQRTSGKVVSVLRCSEKSNSKRKFSNCNFNKFNFEKCPNVRFIRKGFDDLDENDIGLYVLK